MGGLCELATDLRHSDARVAMTDETFPILSWLFSHGEDTVRSVNIRPWGSYTG